MNYMSLVFNHGPINLRFKKPFTKTDSSLTKFYVPFCNKFLCFIHLDQKVVIVVLLMSTFRPLVLKLVVLLVAKKKLEVVVSRVLIHGRYILLLINKLEIECHWRAASRSE